MKRSNQAQAFVISAKLGLILDLRVLFTDLGSFRPIYLKLGLVAGSTKRGLFHLHISKSKPNKNE